MENKTRVFSGIRATGRLHLGNYYGAIKGMLQLQEEYDCIFSVVDLHTITVPTDPKSLQQSIREVVLDYLAAGLDPKKCHLMIQSQVPEHIELSYYLGTIYPVSRLEDLPTYKDKKLQYPDYINMGLLYYPVLMAADILIYKAGLVPVGIDQEPHLEVAREIARKFNRLYGETFPEPQRFATVGEHLPSLKGEGKMSKSIEGSHINLTDDLSTIKKRLAGMPTDIGQGKVLPKGGGVLNLFLMVKLFLGNSEFKKYENRYLTSGVKYQEIKEKIAEMIFKELKPLQEKRHYFEENQKLVDKILEDGRTYCSEIARETIKEVKYKIGL